MPSNPSATPSPRPATGQRRKASAWVGPLLKYGVPLVVTVGLCWLLFTGMDWGHMWTVIRTECRLGWILGAMGLSVLSNVIRAGRWQIQLRALGVEASLWELTLAFFGTYSVNLVFPRLGEFWRTGWIAKRRDAPFGTVFGSMVADRLTDTITVGLMTVVALVLAGPRVRALLAGNTSFDLSALAWLLSPWALAGLAAVIAAAIWAWTRFPQSAPVRKIRGLLKGMWEGFAVIGRMPGLGRWLVLTVLLWTCYCSQFWMELMALPLTAVAVGVNGVAMVFVVFVISSLSMGIPSNGGIGPWQWSVILGLSIYSAGIAGLDQTYSTIFANFAMGCQTLLLILLGIFTFICIAFMKKPHARQH